MRLAVIFLPFLITTAVGRREQTTVIGSPVENQYAWNDVLPYRSSALVQTSSEQLLSSGRSSLPNPIKALARLLLNRGRRSPKISFARLSPLPDPIYGKPCARSSHGLSLVNGGRTLVLYGGENKPRTPLDAKQALWLADRLDDDEDGNEMWQWRCIVIPYRDPQPPPRIAHSQAAVDDRYVYVFGGRAGQTMEEEAMNDLWMLDTSTLKWTKVEAGPGSEEAPEKRSFHRMAAVGHNLFVFGGCGQHDRLADLHRFNVVSSEWEKLGSSPILRGRGGANLLILQSKGNSDLAVVAGFAGEETADGQRFDRTRNRWETSPLRNLGGLRPRSVCVTGSFPSLGLNVLFGGEVDPSERGHEGAGGFENDVVFLDGKSAKYMRTVSAPVEAVTAWPEPRGWSDGASYDDGKGKGKLYFFGGLTGDDSNPSRLDDLWRLDARSS